MRYVLVVLAGAATVGNQIMLYGFVAARFSLEIRGSALGFTGGLGRLGGVTGPLLGGSLVASQVSLRWDFGIFAAVAFVAAMPTLVVPSALESQEPKGEEAAAVAVESEA